MPAQAGIHTASEWTIVELPEDRPGKVLLHHFAAAAKLRSLGDEVVPSCFVAAQPGQAAAPALATFW